MWQLFARITLDSAVEGFASRHWTQQLVLWEGRVQSWGRIDRSIPSAAAMPQIASGTLRFADTDLRLRRLLIEDTYRSRTVELFLAERASSPILDTPPIFTAEIESFRTGTAYCEVDVTDKLYSWLDEEFPPLTEDENQQPVFAPVLNGILTGFSGQGAVPVPRISSTRWVVACHPILSLDAVYRRAEGEDAFTLVSDAEYHVVEEEATKYGMSVTFTYLDFVTAQDEAAEIQIDVHGIRLRGGWGTLPTYQTSPNTAIRNPIDFYINMAFFFTSRHGILDSSYLHATESIGILRARFEPGGDLEGFCDTAILEPITAREFLSRFLVSFELQMYQRQSGSEAGLLEFGVLSDSGSALAVSESLILEEAFHEVAGSKIATSILHRSGQDYITGNWAFESALDNEFEAGVLGVTDNTVSPVVRRAKVEREIIEMWYVRDPGTAGRSAQRRMQFQSIGSYRQTFRLPLPEVVRTLELCGSIALSHPLGLQFGGYVAREAKVLRTTYDLDRLAVDVETIVHTPLVPQFEGLSDIISAWYDMPGVSDAMQKYRIQPAETPDDVERLFTLPDEPDDDSERIYVNGILQIPGRDYIMVGDVIGFLNTIEPPATGDVIEAWYDVPGVGNLSRAWIVPSGAIDGANDDFVLPETPVTDSERIYVGIMMMVKGVDYEMSTATTIHFLSGVPQTGDLIYVFYDVVGTRRIRRHRQNPIGPVNGINPLFIIEETPNTGSEEVFVNSVIQFPTTDYSFEQSAYITRFHPAGSRGIRFTSSPRRS